MYQIGIVVSLGMVFLNTMVSTLPTTSLEEDLNRQNVWMPMLRGLPIGREGEIVAEFEVSWLFHVTKLMHMEKCYCRPSK